MGFRLLPFVLYFVLISPNYLTIVFRSLRNFLFIGFEFEAFPSLIFKQVFNCLAVVGEAGNLAWQKNYVCHTCVVTSIVACIGPNVACFKSFENLSGISMYAIFFQSFLHCKFYGIIGIGIIIECDITALFTSFLKVFSSLVFTIVP